MSEKDSVTLLAAALKVMTREPDLTPVELTSEAPVRAKRNYPDRRNTAGRPSGNDERSRSFGGNRRPSSGGRRSGYERRESGGGRRRSDDHQPRNWQ